MYYKLICVDIDGTLLDDKKKLQPQVKQSLQNAADMGILIALVSGRMPSGVEKIEKELGIECVKVCNAGTYILMGEACIGAEYLPDFVLREVYREVAEKYQIPLWIFRDKEWFVTGTDDFIRKEIGYVSYQPKLVDALGLADRWDREGKAPSKLLAAAEPERIQNIYRELKELAAGRFDMACSANTFLEIFPNGVSKGKALKTICSRLDINIEQTIAFGDHELDLPMIEAAGVGIAMGNAIPLVKEKADYVTKSNNEAGIAYALEHYLKK